MGEGETDAAVTCAVWTISKDAGPTAGNNAWDHWIKHIQLRNEFPDIHDFPTYVERAKQFASSTTATQNLHIGLKTERGVQKAVFYNDQTKEFAIKVMSGQEAGRISTYFKLLPENLPAGVSSADDYFLKDIEDLVQALP